MPAGQDHVAQQRKGLYGDFTMISPTILSKHIDVQKNLRMSPLWQGISF